MSDESERFFAALARAEDNLRKEHEAIEARLERRFAEAMATVRELISVQGVARDSTLRDAISVIQKENAQDMATCADNRAKCSGALSDMRQLIERNNGRLLGFERWRDGYGDDPGAASAIRSLLAWRKSYWPRFIIWVVISFGGLLTFFLQFVDIAFK